MQLAYLFPRFSTICCQFKKQHILNKNCFTTSVPKSSHISNLNKHLYELDEDFLYHISLGKNVDELETNFSDVKFVCMGGSPKRMHQFALYTQKLLGHKLPAGQTLANISEASDRYSMYKVGPVLSVNHGIGCPSMSILLHELIKLVHYAKCRDVTFFRLGTCGGVGAAPGTLVVTSEAVDGMFRPEYRTVSGLRFFKAVFCWQFIREICDSDLFSKNLREKSPSRKMFTNRLIIEKNLPKN